MLSDYTKHLEMLNEIYKKQGSTKKTLLETLRLEELSKFQLLVKQHIKAQEKLSITEENISIVKRISQIQHGVYVLFYSDYRNRRLTRYLERKGLKQNL